MQKQMQQQERRTICKDIDILYERIFVVLFDCIAILHKHDKNGNFGISNSLKMDMSAVCMNNTD